MANELTPILPNDAEVITRSRYLPDIWTGPYGTGRFVPRENDLVWKYNTDGSKQEWRVQFVDGPPGYLSTLVPVVANVTSGGVTPPDAVLGDIDDTPSVAHRCYINTTVQPFAMSISAALPAYGEALTHYKLFKGWDINEESGEVISARFNSSGQYIGENIPVVLIGTSVENNTGVKAPAPGHVTVDIPSGDVVTAVFYNDVGGVVYVHRLIVSNTNFVRSSEASKRQIIDIELVSAWLSTTESLTIDYPSNVTHDTVQMYAVVHYTDGAVQYPIDGDRFRIDGAQAYIPGQTGQSIPVTLSYRLVNGEEVFAGNGLSVGGGRVMKGYRIRSVAYEGAYDVKLFGYPRWINAVNGYTLEWWLYDMERKTRYYVTPLVEFTTNSADYNPTMYGVRQNLEVAVNLQSVNSEYRNWRHVQSYAVNLVKAGSIASPANWRIYFGEAVSAASYGDQLSARISFVSGNQYNLNIASGYGSKEAWLKAVFFDTFPLFNPVKEIAPPTPTHFTVEFKNNSYEYSVNDWNVVKVVINDYAQGELLKLHFYKQLAGERLMLATACLPVHMV